MSVYTRYFRVTSGQVMDKALKIHHDNEAARKVVLDFCAEIGAENALAHGDGTWAGFKFAATPDQSIWKQPNSFGAYWPRKNTADGKEMLKRIGVLPRIFGHSVLLPEAGLFDGPAIIDGQRGYFPTVFGAAHLGVMFISVPWLDEDPKVLADYLKEKEAGRRFDTGLDHLQWKPTADMVEVKHWEVEKEIEELNARQRASEKQEARAAA